MFRSVLYGEDPVSDLSLHVLRAMRSALWVVGYGSLVTPILPTRATGSALCVMGGRLWFLGHAYSSYTCTGSALDVMDYGLAKAKSSVKN